MITMKTGSKTPVRFVFSDDVSETTITIQPDDDSRTVAAKLQRVLDMEHGTGGYVSPPHLIPTALQTDFTPADRAEYEQRLLEARPMGWGEGVDIDSLPEA